MPPKKKKEGAPAATDALKAFDRQYFELTIADLNNKLAHLRTFNVATEERNIDLEVQMRQLEEDRSDVTAFLDRSLLEKTNINKELEEKLEELGKVRLEENTEFLRQIREHELKYKAMQEELTSEIKLLTGKLNSLEEFRVQKDELLAKFDQQETELRIQTKQHRDLIYDIERKQVMDKDLLKKEVENKLLTLSNEFAKSNEIRISAHVQRLVRENIALNNELDRMMFSQRRLQKENSIMTTESRGRHNFVETFKDENEHLIKVCDQQVEIIRRLTGEFEALQTKNAVLCEAESLRKVAEKREKDTEKKLSEYEAKVYLLEQHVHAIRSECVNHQTLYRRQAKEMNYLNDVLLKLKYTVQSAARGETQCVVDDPEFRKAQRKNLLIELSDLLTSVTEMPEGVPSFETVGPVDERYQQGDMGISPQLSMSAIMTMQKSLYIQQETRLKASELAWLEEHQRGGSYESFPIVDLVSGSSLVIVESSKDDEPPEEDEELEEQDDGETNDS